MHDAFFVRCRESMRDLNAVVDRLAHRHRAMLQQMPQRVALQQLGDQVRRALKDAELVDGKNVGMVERGGGLRFLLESAETVGILRNKGGQDLDRHFPLQNRVTGAIDLAHSARTQQADNFITIEFRACG